MLLNSLLKNRSAVSSLCYFTQKGNNKFTLFLEQCNNFCSSFQNVRNVNNSAKPISALLKQQFRFMNALSSTSPAVSKIQTQKKRVPRKKPVDDEKLLKSSNVVAFATADEYDLEKLRLGLLRNSPYIPTDIEDFHRADLLYTETSSVSKEDDREQRQIYFFPEGAVVLWNVGDDETTEILKYVKQYELSSYDSDLVSNEKEEMPYSYSEDVSKSDLIKGEIVLASNKGNIPTALDRYTFSNALMLSVKLGVWEGLLEEYIASVEVLTDDLKLGNKISISREDVLKKTGELFALRHTINLSSDVLDIPDFYWDREDLESLYIKMCNYLSISRRTKVVNEKLNHCLELLDLITSHLNDKHHVRLEWMIIILIMVEVSIATIHLLFVR